jgi:hypothetical protein
MMPVPGWFPVSDTSLTKKRIAKKTVLDALFDAGLAPAVSRAAEASKATVFTGGVKKNGRMVRRWSVCGS